MGLFDLPARSVHDALLTLDDAPADTATVESFMVREIAAHAWDELAKGFRDVVPEQTECFSAQRWGADRLKRLVFLEDGNPVGAVTVLSLTVPGTKVPFNAIRWGPMWQPFGVADCPQRLQRLYRAVRHVLADRPAGFLALIPQADPVHGPLFADALRVVGFRPQRLIPSPERYFVSLDGGPDAVKASLSQKWRYNMKKAYKSGLSVAWETSPSGLATFRDLYGQMVDRKRFLDQSPINTLQALVETSHPDLRPQIVTVRKDGEAVASAVIDMSGERAIYLFGATSRSALPLRAGYLMQWAVIERLTSMPHMRWYDLGGADSTESSLHQFKRGLTGKQGAISDQTPVYVYAGSSLASLLGHCALTVHFTKRKVAHLLHDLRYGFGSKPAR